MSEYAQQQRRFARRHPGEDQAAAARDLRNEELGEDVACCLDEIDEVLSREQDERDQARREFGKFDRRTSETVLKRWQAKYAHLGLSYGWCCGMPYLVDPKDEGK